MEKQKKVDNRERVYATLVYPESAPQNWLQILDDMHIECCVSPLHDKDVNPSGELKKPHYHVLLIFNGNKSLRQFEEIRSTFGGVGREKVLSLRCYARYLCHLDNPEKAQYKQEDVINLGGADYNELIKLVIDKYKSIQEMRDFIVANNIVSYSDLFDYCSENRMDWFRTLCDNGTVVIKEYLKSREWTVKERERQQRIEKHLLNQMVTSTEVVPVGQIDF